MATRISFAQLAVLILSAGDLLVELASFDGEPVPGELRLRALRMGRYFSDIVNSGAVDGVPR